jgi:hypothetical protein
MRTSTLAASAGNACVDDAPSHEPAARSRTGAAALKYGWPAAWESVLTTDFSPGISSRLEATEGEIEPFRT